MTTYTVPAFLIISDDFGIPIDANPGEMEIITPVASTSFSYTTNAVEDFDGLGFANVVSLNQNIYSKVINPTGESVRETNYVAIFDVTWGAGNQTTVMFTTVTDNLRVGVALGGDPIPVFNSMPEYYAWVDTFTSFAPPTSGPYAAGQNISFASLPGTTATQAEVILGTPGNDRLEGSAGDDSFDGLAGTDTVVLDGPGNAYTVSISPAGLVVEDRRNGLDTLESIERLEFSGGVSPVAGNIFDIGQFDGIIGLSSEQILEVTELYIAYFNRAPDAIGLFFWGNAYADGVSLESMAALFIDQDETRARFSPDISNADFATEVYNNVLGRVADQAGYDFWVGNLDSGAVGRDLFILDVLAGAKASPPPGASAEFIQQQLADRVYLENKVEIGAYFALEHGMSNVGNASTTMAAFDGTASGFNAAVSAADGFASAAELGEGGEFLLPLVGVFSNPEFSGL